MHKVCILIKISLLSTAKIGENSTKYGDVTREKWSYWKAEGETIVANHAVACLTDRFIGCRTISALAAM